MLAQDQLQSQALAAITWKEQQFQSKPEANPPQRAIATLDTPPEADHTPTKSQAITPGNLKKFRRGYGDHAAQVAQQLKGIIVTSAEGILQKAKLILDTKLHLNRKEWGVWLREMLGWFGNEATPYLQIAKMFKDFEPAGFRELEPFTILKLRTKKYAPIVARLREELAITSQVIQNLIKEVIPKQSRQKKAAPNYGEAVLKQRLNAEDGTFYFTLNANLGDKPGSWLEGKLENCTVGQVLEQAAALEQQVEERHAMQEVLDAQIEQRVRNRVEIAEFALKQEIAELKAQLLESARNSLGLVDDLTASTGLQDAVVPEAIEESTVSTGLHSARTPELVEETGLKLSSDHQVAASSEQLNEDPDIQVAELALEQPREHESAPAKATDCSEPVAETTHPQPSDNSTASLQLIAPPWNTIKQLRNAESYIHQIDAQIKDFTSKLASSGLDRAIERELKGLLANRQKLRSTKVSQVVSLVDSKGIPANYNQLLEQGRVVLDSEYASVLLLQANSWVEVMLVVGCDRTQLVKAVTDDWTMESKLNLVQLLSSNLETEPNALSQIDWIPEVLRDKALSTLSFKIRRIGGPDNLVDEPKLEYIPCNFVSLKYPGTKHERWVFKDSNDNNHPVFGRDEIEIEKF